MHSAAECYQNGIITDVHRMRESSSDAGLDIQNRSSHFETKLLLSQPRVA